MTTDRSTKIDIQVNVIKAAKVFRYCSKIKDYEVFCYITNSVTRHASGLNDSANNCSRHAP